MRLRPWLPLLSVLAQVGLALFVALWIDRSDLPQPVGSWGYAFGVVVIALLYLSLPGLLLLGCALAGSFARSGDAARTATIVGAVVAALVGVAGLVLGAPELLRADGEADRVFATALLVTSVVPLLPLLVAFRREEAAT
ncbi:hypothetical protein GCM10009623_31020 [Nocardioides aestuarii]|uniref:Histidine kinase n=1 Tax=Nocardioides aestuarii TaxID=252231 RepID=A0ABW4TRR9_9ACTN